jgi:hypothetical protein
MNELLAPGDLLIDLAWNIDSCEHYCPIIS